MKSLMLDSLPRAATMAAMTPADRFPPRTLWALAALGVAAGLVVAPRSGSRSTLSSRGSGLRGLLDRVAALDGGLELESPPGRGTRVEAAFPVGSR
jgi:hypothetical protein